MYIYTFIQSAVWERVSSAVCLLVLPLALQWSSPPDVLNVETLQAFWRYNMVCNWSFHSSTKESKKAHDLWWSLHGLNVGVSFKKEQMKFGWLGSVIFAFWVTSRSITPLSSMPCTWRMESTTRAKWFRIWYLGFWLETMAESHSGMEGKASGSPHAPLAFAWCDLL